MSSSTVDNQIATAASVRADDDALTVELSDGRVLSVPIAWFPRLSHATLEERNNWRPIAAGRGIHWPDLDEDISIEGLLAGKASGESQSSFKRWLDRRLTVTVATKVYRKGKGSDVWHWCDNCSTWPTSDYQEQDIKPTVGELCNECQIKYKAGMCNA